MCFFFLLLGCLTVIMQNDVINLKPPVNIHRRDFSVKYETSCVSAVKILKRKIFTFSYILDFSKNGEGVDLILWIFKLGDSTSLWKNGVRQVITQSKDIFMSGKYPGRFKVSKGAFSLPFHITHPFPVPVHIQAAVFLLNFCVISTHS